ncbi:hypothetical protein CRM22_008231 [Opisthorchis felineus]|uniref:isopentenyl-diphosphate Delta-isomerase n=1 Tax=Opisthorchis felineus TaxID=147828 RepID=A0A4S2LE83_OPIFE|nr:hypothetical protein CRM22_008231 [Opisthorchis felineus]
MRFFRERLLSILNAIRKFTECAAPGGKSKHLYEIQEHYMSTESCLKVDESDRVLGYASKKDCHEVINGAIPPLHRAFSLFLFRKLQPCLPASPLQLLIQRRAASKFTYPNLWSNTCCSHPIVNLPSELVEENALGVRLAAQRKIEHELGMSPDSVVPLSSLHFLTRFIYSAPNEPSDNSQWAEHEMDYILVSILDPKIDTNLESGLVKLNPEEVSDVQWIGEDDLHNILLPTAVETEQQAVSSGNLKRQDFTPWVRGLASSGYLRRIWRWAEEHNPNESHAVDHESSRSAVFDKDAIIRLDNFCS